MTTRPEVTAARMHDAAVAPTLLDEVPLGTRVVLMSACLRAAYRQGYDSCPGSTEHGAARMIRCGWAMMGIEPRLRIEAGTW